MHYQGHDTIAVDEKEKVSLTPEGSSPLSSPLHAPDSSIKEPVPADPIVAEPRVGVHLPVGSASIEDVTYEVTRYCTGLNLVDPARIAERVHSGLNPRTTPQEFETMMIQVVSAHIAEEPEYSKLAAKILDNIIANEVYDQGIECFSDSIRQCHEQGLISDEVMDFVNRYRLTLDCAIDPMNALRFEYFGLQTVYDRYLLRHPKTRKVMETPQYFFMRVACGLGEKPLEVKEVYRLIAKFDFMFSTPTLFNSATRRPQLSSCFLLDSPSDSLEGIYDKYKDIAQLSKFSGGIGVGFSRVRSKGSLIEGTNGKSNGIVPFLKTLDSSVLAVNQGGKRKGAACVYLESWHADIEEFLELRENTGDEARRTYNLNLANWVPDLFMERVQSDQMWSLFDPKKIPQLVETYGDEFRKVYEDAEKEGLFDRQLKARDLYARMMKTLAQTGNGWMTFKDACNLKNNQTGQKGRVIHLSNLCTEITEVTSNEETAVCNLGSVNLARHVKEGQFQFEQLEKTVMTAVKYLDRVVDLNFYPIPSAKHSNHKWRPIGLGAMGLHDVFYKMRVPLESAEAVELTARIQERIYLAAMTASCELAQQYGPHETFSETRAAQGKLQFDLWGVEPAEKKRWDELKKQIKEYGLRNSLTIAIAPTATIASIVGCCESIDPQVSNLFKRETLSGEFLQINKYLVQDLKERGLWDDQMRNEIKLNEGSVQSIERIPADLRRLYKTAWEVSMKSVIDLGAARGAFIDQSQSLNLFIENPSIGKLSSMYMYAWQKGLKTTYYLRSRAATKISKTTVQQKQYQPEEAVACSLENPDACEACQ